MARGRILSKSISHSSKLQSLYEKNSKLAEFATILFTWIIPHTDDFGQITGDVTGIKLLVMPASPRKKTEFQAALNLLINTNLLETKDGVIRVVNFDNFQTFRTDRNKQSMFSGIDWDTPDIPTTTNDIPRYDVSKDKGSEVKLREDKKTLMSKVKILFDMWNQYAVNGIKKANKLTPSRIDKIKTRLKEQPDIEYWRGIFSKLQKLPFYCGRGNRKWRVGIDYVMENDKNHVQVSEEVVLDERDEMDYAEREYQKLKAKGRV